MLYYKFSQFLKDKYGTKVYKLPLNIAVTCPNRDGRLGSKGCIFCGEEGAGFENLSSCLSITDQLSQNARYIGKNYGSSKFIAYFQNYSNTYIPYNMFVKYISEACVEDVVAIYISTRPDCIQERQLEFLSELSAKKGIDIVLELGLQTVNYHTLKLINRGHTLAEFIDSAVRIKRYGLGLCAHYITDLPMDNMADVIEGAKILSALKVDQVKCHSLFVLKETELGDMYQSGELVPVTLEQYIDRTIAFLEYLEPHIVIQRLIGRAPEERTLFCNWGTSWWKIVEQLERTMMDRNTHQGSKFNYLGGLDY